MERIEKNEFRMVLESAIKGDEASIEKIMTLYMPLIESKAYLYGKLDEDLKQYLLMKVFRNIPKFRIK